MDKKKYLLSLQVLRGVLAAIILLYHGSLELHNQYNPGYSLVSRIFKQGFSGIDLFFILSGFVLYYNHSQDFGIKGKAKAFLIKRFLRIYPLYWIVAIFTSIALFVLYKVKIWEQTSFFIKSLLLIPQNAFPVVAPAWTLSYIVFFYFVFALVIYKPKIFIPISSLWLIIIAANLIFKLDSIIVRGNSILGFLFSWFFLEFLAGILIAYLVTHFELKNRLLILMCGLFLFGVVWAIDINLHRILVLGIPLSLIVIGLSSLDLHNEVYVPKVFNYLGNASYSIFILHYPIVVNIMIGISKLNNWYSTMDHMVMYVIIIGSGLGLSILMYQYIEKPLLANNKIITQKFIKT